MKLINFSLDGKKKLQIEKTVKNSINQFGTNINAIGACVKEAYDWLEVEQKQIISFVNALEDHGVSNYQCVVSSNYLLRGQKITALNVIPIEFDALDTVYRIRFSKQKFNTNWNSKAKKPLLLTGKSSKENRIGLLAVLLENKLLDKIEYSFFPQNEFNKLSKKIFSKYTNYSFTHFKKHYKRSPDNIKVLETPHQSHYSGYPFSAKIFKNTIFSIISETDFNGIPEHIDVTEKTYKTIANKHPFIVAAQPYFLQRLKELGFFTFEEFQLNSSYDKIKDNKERLYAISENIKHWMDIIHTQQSEIKMQVDHNYNNLLKLHNNTIQKYNIFQNEEFYHNFFTSNQVKNEL
jgi:hypothetical protein